MRATEIDVQFEPPRSTAQEKQYTVKNGKVRVYETANAKAAKQLLRLVLAPHAPREPQTGAVTRHRERNTRGFRCNSGTPQHAELPANHQRSEPVVKCNTYATATAGG